MNFNWGTGIALFFSTFAIAMISLVFASRRYDPGLVQKDYYALDLNYQDRLERKQQTAALVQQPQIIPLADTRQLKIQFPPEMENCNGKARFYRSATVKDDFSVKIEGVSSMEISSEKMAPGRWHVELEWEAAGKKYFWEQAFQI